MKRGSHEVQLPVRIPGHVVVGFLAVSNGRLADAQDVAPAEPSTVDADARARLPRVWTPAVPNFGHSRSRVPSTATGARYGSGGGREGPGDGRVEKRFWHWFIGDTRVTGERQQP